MHAIPITLSFIVPAVVIDLQSTCALWVQFPVSALVFFSKHHFDGIKQHTMNVIVFSGELQRVSDFCLFVCFVLFFFNVKAYSRRSQIIALAAFSCILMLACSAPACLMCLLVQNGRFPLSGPLVTQYYTWYPVARKACEPLIIYNKSHH